MCRNNLKRFRDTINTGKEQIAQKIENNTSVENKIKSKVNLKNNQKILDQGTLMYIKKQFQVNGDHRDYDRIIELCNNLKFFSK